MNEPEGARLSHVDEAGIARMVDVGEKDITARRAVAEAFVTMRPETIAAIAEGSVPKGDAIGVARVAGIMAAKRTAELVPLCHPLPLTHVSVDLEPQQEGVSITASASTSAQTGVEMEALAAATVAALTLYDMCKAVDRGMTITDVRLVFKEGGASGPWARGEGVSEIEE